MILPERYGIATPLLVCAASRAQKASVKFPIVKLFCMRSRPGTFSSLCRKGASLGDTRVTFPGALAPDPGAGTAAREDPQFGKPDFTIA